MAREQSPDLVLLDLLMPLMPGMELLRSLKADGATRHIPVLILSNSSRDDDSREPISVGAAGYLVKANISLKELGDHVERFLRAP